MTCNDYQPLLSAHLDRQLSWIEQKAVAAHLSTCQGCQEESNAILSLKERMRRYSLPSMPAELRTQIESLTRPSATLSLGERARGEARRLWLPAFAGVAAAVGAWLFIRQHQTPIHSAPVEVVAQPTQIQEHPRMAMHQDPNSLSAQGCEDKPVGC